jgi:predicted small lipoprotein YifL
MLSAVILLCLAGCGLKGPLTLPGEGKEAVVAPSPAPATTTHPRRQATPPLPAPQSQKAPGSAAPETPQDESPTHGKRSEKEQYERTP